MSQIIKIKRSTGSGVPSTIAAGELAYSKGSGTLYIGDPDTNNANTPIAIGGAIINNAGTPALGAGVTATEIQNLIELGTANNPTFNNLTLNGNLTVNGTTTTLNTATLDVQDTNITLNHGSGDTSGSANGSGITIQDAVDASTDASITWNTSGNAFNFSNAIQLGGNLLVSSSRRIYASDGTDTKAAFGFSSSSSTGLSYETTRNRIKFLSGGAVRAYIQTPSSNPIAPAMYVDGRTEINGRVYATGDGNSGNWKEAYDWGNHADADYLTSFTETDPTVPSHVKSITSTQVSNWDSAYGWGNHASQGYVTAGTADFTDRWIELNKTSSITNGNGGLYVSRAGTNQDAVLFWDETAQTWKFGKEGYGQSIGVGDITGVTLSNNSDQSSPDASIMFGASGSNNTAAGTQGDLTFRMQVGTIDGGTY